MFFAERKREVEARLLYDGRDCGAAECSEIIHQASRLKSTCLNEGMLPNVTWLTLHLALAPARFPVR